MKKTDIVIIGAGPAGMMSAIYAMRANKEIILLDKNAPGGRIRSTYQVDNYLGFGKVTAQELVEKMVNHLRDLGIEETYGFVEKITTKDNGFSVMTDRDEITCKAIIVASGTNPKRLRVENEEEFLTRGISYCAVCDGIFFQNDDVAVIGGGDSALEESIYLSQIAKHVTIIHDLDRFTATKGIVERVKDNPKITCLLSTKVIGFIGTDELQAIRLIDLKTLKESTLPVQGAFIYVGNEVDADFLTEYNVVDKMGYVRVNQEMATKVPGMFACGDITKKDYRFIVTAISDGAIAALSAVKYLDSLIKTE
ncbi:MAG: FAD-dependent oxidoreductase [Bacilli bacterium]|nr:FAD-dependent oxidoreductase [Bacilli bacterium]